MEREGELWIKHLSPYILFCLSRVYFLDFPVTQAKSTHSLFAYAKLHWVSVTCNTGILTSIIARLWYGLDWEEDWELQSKQVC